MMFTRFIGTAATITFAFNSSCSSSIYCTEAESRSKWDSNWDKRASWYNNKVKNVEERSVTATRHIILIRHGQYVVDATADKKVFYNSVHDTKFLAYGTGDIFSLHVVPCVVYIYNTYIYMYIYYGTGW